MQLLAPGIWTVFVMDNWLDIHLKTHIKYVFIKLNFNYFQIKTLCMKTNLMCYLNI